jgi:alkylated DNA repair dioxygenase AlkB
MNFYRNHRDGAGWHADRPANRPEQAVVPVLSLGAQRRFLIQPVGGGRSTVFTPRAGDLLVMGGRAQRDWRHAAPKQTRPAGPRIILYFTSRAQIDAR